MQAQSIRVEKSFAAAEEKFEDLKFKLASEEWQRMSHSETWKGRSRWRDGSCCGVYTKVIWTFELQGQWRARWWGATKLNGRISEFTSGGW
jgi:hypothetical protein